MRTMITNIKFKRVTCKYQQALAQDIKQKINNEKVLVAADKTTNYYQLNKEDYVSLLSNNITKDYKKLSQSTISSITKKDKKIATELQIQDSCVQS